MGHYDDIRDEYDNNIQKDQYIRQKQDVLRKIKSGYFKNIINATLLINEESKLVTIKISDLELMLKLLDK